MGATKKDRRINTVLSVLFTILCIAWLYPVFMILMNSLKTERAITTANGCLHKAIYCGQGFGKGQRRWVTW